MAQCIITCGIADRWLGYGNQKGYSTYSKIKDQPQSGSKVKIKNLQLKMSSAKINSGINGIYLHFNINNTYSAYITNVPSQSISDYSTNLLIRGDHIAALGDFLSSFTENTSIAIEVSSGSVSQALWPSGLMFQLIFDYEYTVAAPVLNKFSSEDALAGSNVTLSWTDAGNTGVTLAQYKIYNWGSEMASISPSSKTYTFTIPSDLANQSLYSFTVAAVDTNGNISLKSNEVLLRVYQKIKITSFNIYNNTNQIIKPYIGSSLEGKPTTSSYKFKWSYNSFNDGRTIMKVEFADNNTLTSLVDSTELEYSSKIQLNHSYYIQITDSLGFKSTSEKITISEYVPPKYTLTLPQSGRLESRGMKIIINVPSGELISEQVGIRINGKKEITTTSVKNTCSFTISNKQVSTRTNFYLGVEYSQNAPIEGTSSQIVDVDTTTFFFQTAPAAPVISGNTNNATDINYSSPYVYETVKIQLSNLASATSDSGTIFEYFIKYNDIQISATVGEDKSITAPIVQLPIDKLKDGINVQIVAVDNYGESVISTTSSSTFYKLILPTVEIIGLNCSQDEEANKNTLTVTYKINGSNITGVDASKTDSTVSFYSTSLGQVIATKTINYASVENKNATQKITVDLSENNNLKNKIITGQEPTLQDSLSVSFYFDNFDKYISNSNDKTFNYNFITYPTGSIAEITKIIPYDQQEINLSSLSWEDAIGGLSGVKQINLILTPNNTNYDIIRIPWKTTTDTTLKSSYNYTYQQYFSQATDITYVISFELVYKSIIIPYTLPNTTKFTITKWTPENAVITKADENEIIFKFPDNTPCGDENSFSKVDLTIGEETITNLTIADKSFTYTYKWSTAPTTDTSYNITLTYYNTKGGTIEQKFNNYIVHISGATIAVRKQFLGINVAEDYGTGTENLNSYPIIAINSLKDLADTTPILKISTSGNDLNKETKLLYFNSGTKNIGGFFKSKDNKGFIAENLLGIKNGDTITEFSDVLTNTSAQSIYLKQADAENTYLTQTKAQIDYLTKADAKTYYLTKGVVNDSQTGTNLWTSNRITDYVTNKINSIPEPKQVTRSTFNLEVPTTTEWTYDSTYDDYYKNFEHEFITSTDQEISISCVPCTKFPITAAKLTTSGGKYYLQIRMMSPPESSQEIAVSVITIP